MYDVLALKLVHPWRKNHTLLTDTFLITAGSLFVAAMAQISIPLPFSPVPITGQTFAVLLVGMALGSKRGMFAMLMYLFEGGIGLPFFANGRAGLAVIVGPTGGYLIGFIVAAWLVGKLSERGMDRNILSSLIAFILGSIPIYLFGALWLSTFIGYAQAVQVGVLPFLIGDLFKAVLAGAAMPTAWHFVNNVKKI